MEFEMGVGNNINTERGRWEFTDQVVENFDQHVELSVPGYLDGHNIIVSLGDYFISEGSTIIDIGCSTGSLLCKMSDNQSGKKDLNFIGIEPQDKFCEVTTKKLNSRPQIINSTHTFKIEQCSVTDFEFIVSDMIISYYTIQFIKPRFRQIIFDNVFKSLNWGGAFLFFEKIRAQDARFQDLLTSIYFEYKRNNGFSNDEILEKFFSLKGAMEPYTSSANRDYLSRAGFSDMLTIYKNICFEGILAIK